MPSSPLIAAGLSLLILAGCNRSPEPITVDGVTYGTTNTAFRGRWWHYYERGVSWALGGFYERAEADFRACLSLRGSDSRRARTYGFHFVQCFAHRELAAVLIAQGGDLAEARRLLERSLSQEPSAKAQWLLLQLDNDQKDGPATTKDAGLAVITPVDTPDGGKAPPPPSALDLGESLDAALAEADDVPITRPALALRTAQLQIDHIELPKPSAPDHDHTPSEAPVQVSGRLDALEGVILVALARDGSRRPVTMDQEGAFTADLAVNESLAVAIDPSADPLPLAQPAALPAEPTLVLDGPEDGAVVNQDRLYYRFTASADGGLARLQVMDQTQRILSEQTMEGIQRAGTVTIPVDPAISTLHFALSDQKGQRLSLQRNLTVRPPPTHKRNLRAVAYIVPLQSPEDGAGLNASDNPLLQGAVVEDGRFRILDQAADDLLKQELSLVDAGYVDRSTAARTGRRLDADYVLVGTVRRGRGDLECYLRLVHSDSGTVVAIADAYMRRQNPTDDARFFESLAGRLRQTFPVIDGIVPATDEQGRTALSGAIPQARERMRFYAIEREPDLVDEQTGEVIIPGASSVVGTLEAEQISDRQVILRLIDGSLPTEGSEVVSE